MKTPTSACADGVRMLDELLSSKTEEGTRFEHQGLPKFFILNRSAALQCGGQPSVCCF
jgi:hypothetical protein